MFREIIVSSEKNHSVELPEKFFGKKVEVYAFEMDKKEKQNAEKNF